MLRAITGEQVLHGVQVQLQWLRGVHSNMMRAQGKAVIPILYAILRCPIRRALFLNTLMLFKLLIERLHILLHFFGAPSLKLFFAITATRDLWLLFHSKHINLRSVRIAVTCFSTFFRTTITRIASTRDLHAF